MSESVLSSARAALDSVFDDTFLRYTRRAMYGGLGLPDNGVPSVPNGAQSVPNGDTSVPNGVKEGLGAILERGYAAPMRSVWEKGVSGSQTISSTKLYEEALREGIGQTAYVIGSPDISPRVPVVIIGVLSNPPQVVVTVPDVKEAKILPVATTLSWQRDPLRTVLTQWTLTVPDLKQSTAASASVVASVQVVPAQSSPYALVPSSGTGTKTLTVQGDTGDASGITGLRYVPSTFGELIPNIGQQPLTGGPSYWPYLSPADWLPQQFDSVGKLSQEEVAAAMEALLQKSATKEKQRESLYDWLMRQSGAAAAPAKKEPEKEEKSVPLPGKKAIRRLIE